LYKKETIVDGQSCLLELLDTAGQGEHAALHAGWVRQEQAYIIVYSTTSRSSLSRAQQFYEEILLRTGEQGTKQIPLVYLVGNKCERVTERDVSTQEGFAVAKSLQSSFLEVSSMNAVNIEKLFHGIVRDLRKREGSEAKKLNSTDILKDATVLSQKRPNLAPASRFESFAKRFRLTKDTTVDPHNLNDNHQKSLNELSVDVRDRKRKTRGRLQNLSAGSTSARKDKSLAVDSVDDHPNIAESTSFEQRCGEQLRNLIGIMGNPVHHQTFKGVCVESCSDADSLHISTDGAPMNLSSSPGDTFATSASSTMSEGNIGFNEASPRVSRSLTNSKHDENVTIIPHYNYPSSQEAPWDFVSRLSQGSGSTIEEVIARDTPAPSNSYARKVFLLTPQSRRQLLPIIQNEVSILKAVRHHHVSQIHSTYSTTQEFVIVMVLADMNLGEYLLYNPRPTCDSPIYAWLGCLATAFAYLHERNIKHQDVKPTNILIRDGQVIVADFGISRNVLTEDTTGSIGPTAKTLMYCAPEVAATIGGARRGRKADMFSLGCIFLEMITTLLWAHGFSVPKLHDQIRVNEGRVYSASPQKLLHEISMMCELSRGETAGPAHGKALQWCLSMLLEDPKSRISAHELRVAIVRYTNGITKASATRLASYVVPSWVGRCCLTDDDEGDENNFVHPHPEVHHEIQVPIEHATDQRPITSQTPRNNTSDNRENTPDWQYTEAKEPFKHGEVNRKYWAKLFCPGTVVVSYESNEPEAYISTSCTLSHNDSLHLTCWSWTFDCEFVKSEVELVISWPSGKETIAITDLLAYPLEYAPAGLEQELRRRGQVFWTCRSRKFVHYDVPLQGMELQKVRPQGYDSRARLLTPTGQFEVHGR
jgi:serine/threonine protein kinase